MSKFINPKLNVMTLSKITKVGTLILLVVKPAKGKSAKKKETPKAKTKPVKKAVATKPKTKSLAKKKKLSVKPRAKVSVKKKTAPVKPKAKTKVVKKATAPVKQKTKAVVAKKSSTQIKPIRKMKALKKSTAPIKQKPTPEITKKPIMPRKGEEKLSDLKTKIAAKTTVVPVFHTEGEDLHILPEHDGITHPITPFEQHKKEDIFHRKEEVALHQFNEKIKNARPSKKTMKLFNRKRGL